MTELLVLNDEVILTADLPRFMHTSRAKMQFAKNALDSCLTSVSIFAVVVHCCQGHNMRPA